MNFVEKETVFPISERPSSDPLEKTIASILWNWKFADRCTRDAITCSRSEFCSNIEFYFPFDQIEYTRKRGIWCDGIAELSIEQLGRKGFMIAGVGYFLNQLAPFELEFHFEKRRDQLPQQIILRFAETNHHGEINWQRDSLYTKDILLRRPQVNAGWAVAVELTSIKK